MSPKNGLRLWFETSQRWPPRSSGTCTFCPNAPCPKAGRDEVNSSEAHN